MGETLDCLFESAYTSTYPLPLLLIAGVPATRITRRRCGNDTENQKVVIDRQRKTIRVYLPSSAPSPAAHSEHTLDADSADSPIIGPGAGHPNSK